MKWKCVSFPIITGKHGYVKLKIMKQRVVSEQLQTLIEEQCTVLMKEECEYSNQAELALLIKQEWLVI